MPSSYTSLLGLVLPVQGELSGTWGDTVNNELTSLVDSAVAGTTTLSTDADVTLTDTAGTANQARQIILNCTGARSVLRTITAPARSKAYIVINNTTGGFGVKIVGAGPTTGVTIANGTNAVVAWNGSDFEVISSNSIAGLTGTLPVANGGTNLTTFPALSLPVANTLDTLSALTAAANQSIRVNSGGTAWEAYTPSTGTGDVVGPASAVSGNIATFDGTTGKLIQDGGKALPSGTIVGTTDSQTLTNKTISGASNTLTVDGTNEVGFRIIPQNSQSNAYTAVLADSGKQIFHPSADTTARTFTIPANGSVPYPVGTALTFINQNGAGVITISITTDTMRLAGAGTTGNRTLAANGIATAIKITSTEWIISGTGLT